MNLLFSDHKLPFICTVRTGWAYCTWLFHFRRQIVPEARTPKYSIGVSSCSLTRALLHKCTVFELSHYGAVSEKLRPNSTKKILNFSHNRSILPEGTQLQCFSPLFFRLKRPPGLLIYAPKPFCRKNDLIFEDTPLPGHFLMYPFLSVIGSFCTFISPLSPRVMHLTMCALKHAFTILHICYIRMPSC